ncbi:MAG: BrnT family toxin [Syntrophales bacterium]
MGRHSVSPEEVEETLFNDDDTPLIMRGREGRYLSYGKTDGGRFLLIVLTVQYRKTRIITARDMTEKEKQHYRRSRR